MTEMPSGCRWSARSLVARPRQVGNWKVSVSRNIYYTTCNTSHRRHHHHAPTNGVVAQYPLRSPPLRFPSLPLPVPVPVFVPTPSPPLGTSSLAMIFHNHLPTFPTRFTLPPCAPSTPSEVSCPPEKCVEAHSAPPVPFPWCSLRTASRQSSSSHRSPSSDRLHPRSRTSPRPLNRRSRYWRGTGGSDLGIRTDDEGGRSISPSV